MAYFSEIASLLEVSNSDFIVDLISKRLIILTLWLTALILLAQYHINYKNLLRVILIILIVSLILTFRAKNILMFYFFFEWSLIPIFLIIMGWGYQPERIKARISLFFYTLFASLPLLLVLLLLNFRANSIILNLLIFVVIYSNKFYLLTILRVLAFLVKFPMFTFHLWLPKAHVEAPVSGSIILAGVLLKLGGYGLIRIYFLLRENLIIILIISISLIGSGLLGIICLIQRDIKVVIAYSSVVHIALIIVGVLIINNIGVEGAILVIIAHGICSSGIFAGANLIYERSHSRRYFLNKGYLNTTPFFSIFWFILIVANFGGPFTYNLLGEILLIVRLRQIVKLSLFIVCFLSFFSAAYRLVIYSSTQQGQALSLNQTVSFFSCREYIMLISHAWPLILIPLNGSII